MTGVARALILIGIGCIALGFLWPWLGRLPGDIVIERHHFRFYFPITSAVLVSVLVSVLLSLFRH
ncbi:MAG: DUF2905 domain-containing protein [Acidiferrobacteraceae bacterium]